MYKERCLNVKHVITSLFVKCQMFDWDLYCDVVEEILNDIPCVCDTCAFHMLFMYYHEKFKMVKEVILSHH